jgi:hypothetical protein
MFSNNFFSCFSYIFIILSVALWVFLFLPVSMRLHISAVSMYFLFLCFLQAHFCLYLCNFCFLFNSMHFVIISVCIHAFVYVLLQFLSLYFYLFYVYLFIFVNIYAIMFFYVPSYSLLVSSQYEHMLLCFCPCVHACVFIFQICLSIHPLSMYINNHHLSFKLTSDLLVIVLDCQPPCVL